MKAKCSTLLAAMAVAFVATADVLQPSGTDDTAAIQAAINDAPEGGTVTLGDGLFILTDEILVARPVTVKSEHGRDFTQVYQKSGDVDHMYRTFHLNDKDAKIEGLALSTYGTQLFNQPIDSHLPGSCVYIDAEGGQMISCIVSNCYSQSKGCVNLASGSAVVSNCVIRNNKTSSIRNLQTTTCGLQMSAGLVTHTTIDGNVNSYGSGYGACLGGGAYLSGGCLRYSSVTNNALTRSCNTGTLGGGIYASGSSVVVENCLIAGNSALNGGGGVCATAGAFTNCTIVANTSLNGAGGLHLPAKAKPTFYGCIIQDNVNASGYSDISGTTGTFVHSVTDGSVAFAPGGYVPQFGSSAVDICPAADYAVDPQTTCDLSGASRLSGTAVDAGAYEYRYPDFVAFLDILTDSVLPPGETFVFTGKVVCAHLDLVSYGWSVDGGSVVWTSSPRYEVKNLAAGVHSVSLRVTYDSEDKGVVGTISVLVTAPEVFVVDPARNPGHEAVYPYSSGSGAATNLADAIGCARRGTTVKVGPGVHDLKLPLELPAGVSLVSTHGRDETVIRQTIAGGLENRCVYLNDPDSVLDGFALTGGNGDLRGIAACIDTNGGVIRNCIATNNQTGVSGGTLAVLSASGVISNCIIRSNRARNSNSATGPVGLYVSKGRVVCSDVSGNTNACGTTIRGNCGTGVYLAGGTLASCVIRLNSCLVDTVNGYGTKGGGLYVSTPSGESSIVENCLIAENEVLRQGGGVWADSGCFTNCTIVGNSSTMGAGGLSVTAAVKLYGCIVQDNVNASGFTDIDGTPGAAVHCVTDGSVTFEAGGYVPQFGTAAVDVCPVEDYAVDPRTVRDLAGTNRLSGAAVDAGAFEYQYSDFAMSLELLTDSVLPPGETFSFTGRVICADASLVEYGWSVDGGSTAWGTVAHYDATGLSSGVHAVALAVRYDGADKGVAGAISVLVTCPDVYVVDPALDPGHEPVYPYATRDGAATNIQDAVGCARRGTTIHVGPGVYRTSTPLDLIGAVKLVSDNGRDETVLRQVATVGTENRIVRLNDPDALVDGFALTGGSGHLHGIAACIDANGGQIRNCIATNNITGSSGGTLAVLSANGVISNCIVRFNTAIAGDNSAAGPVGLYMSAGLVADCDLSCNTNAYGYSWGGNSGIGAYVAGGRLTRCSICDNAAARSTVNGQGCKGAGVYITSTSAVVDNCLIARNWSEESRGAVAFSAAGKLINCTVVDNVVPSTDVTERTAGVFTIANKSDLVVNTIIQGNVSTNGVASEFLPGHPLAYKNSLCPVALPENKDNIQATAVFKGANDYRLANGSPGARTGTVVGYEQYLVGGRDLDGKARTTARNKIDMGCYQSDGGGLMLMVR